MIQHHMLEIVAKKLLGLILKHYFVTFDKINILWNKEPIASHNYKIDYNFQHHHHVHWKILVHV